MLKALLSFIGIATEFFVVFVALHIFEHWFD